MILPEIDDFFNSLSKEELQDIIGNPKSFHGNLLSSDGLSEYTTVILGQSYLMTQRLLRLYHKWLAEQLSNQK